jgi:hypothetical protein
MHPLYDSIIADVVSLSENAYVVITQGRKPYWTHIYHSRLNRCLRMKILRCLQNNNPSHVCNAMFERLISIPRVSAQHFNTLLEGLADVLLHPFPFDGSRTSADGLALGIPIITLPTEYLRGRMGQTFLRTMDIPELVAHNVSEYISIARRFVVDKSFLLHMRQLIIERQSLIWEDMYVPYEWSNFLCSAAGILSPSWYSYLLQSGRNDTYENILHQKRTMNRLSFKRRWGDEAYLRYGLRKRAYELQPTVIVNDGDVGSGSIGVTMIASALNGFIPHASVLEDNRSLAYDAKSSTSVYWSPVALSVFRDWNASTDFLSSYLTGESASSLSMSIIDACRGLIKPSLVCPSFSEVDILLADKKIDEAATMLDEIIKVTGEYALEVEKLELASNEYVIKHEVITETEAPILLHKALQANPQLLEMYTRAQLERGGIAFASGEYLRALDSCGIAAFLVPQLGIAHGCAGAAALHAKNEDATFKYLKNAVVWERANEGRMKSDSWKTDATMADRIYSETSLSILQNNAVSSILKAYWLYNRSIDAIIFAGEYMSLPFFGTEDEAFICSKHTDKNIQYFGGIYIFVFSFVDWSSFRVSALQEVEKTLVSTKRMKLPEGMSFISELRRIQKDYSDIVNDVIISLMGWDGGRLVIDASSVLMDVIRTAHSIRNPSTFSSPPRKDIGKNNNKKTKAIIDSKSQGFILITQYWISNSSHTQQNIHAALFKNLVNPLISRVVLMCEVNVTIHHFKGFTNHNKILLAPYLRRATFADAFQIANDNFSGFTIILANRYVDLRNLFCEFILIT